MRVIEASELIAADVFTHAEKTASASPSGTSAVSGAVGQSSTRLRVWPLWAGVAGNGAARLRNRLRVAARDQGHPTARTALALCG